MGKPIGQRMYRLCLGSPEKQPGTEVVGKVVDRVRGCIDKFVDNLWALLARRPLKRRDLALSVLHKVLLIYWRFIGFLTANFL
jgi:hypothetical protein